MAQTTFDIHSSGPGLYEFTGQVMDFVRSQPLNEGVLTLFCQHTSCSLLVQENADPAVQSDLNAFFRRLAPQADDPSMSYLTHRTEGPDDMPAHIRAALTQTSIAIPITNGMPALGTWQGIYLFEHRNRPHHRRIVAHLS